ncbi:MAG TPA: hypothetical protein VFD92_16710 [Candidatus Binatia bacterium]|nr:hypothetical protein [Candidatus Binatia bacterium]
MTERLTSALANMACALLALSALGACDRSEMPPLVRSTTLGNVGGGYRKNSLTVSHDQRRYAWVQTSGDRCRVVADEKKGPLQSICLDPVFSRNGAAVADWSVPDPGKPPKGYLTVNGTRADVAFGREAPIAFSREGGSWATIAPAYDPEGTPTTPEERGESAPAGEAPPVPDRPRRLLALAERGELGEYYDTTTPAVSPHGEHVAFVAADAEGNVSLVVDGKVERRFEKPAIRYLPVVKPQKVGPNLEPESSVTYLADGSLVTVALAEQGYTVFHDATPWAAYPAVNIPKTGYQVLDPQLLTLRTLVAGSIVTARDAPVACWWERPEGKEDRWRVVCNGQPIDDQLCDNYWVDQPLAISADGKSVAYVCPGTPELSPEGIPLGRPPLSIVFGGQRLGPPHPFVWGVDLSADGRHYAYAAADSVDDTFFYVVDGKRYDGPWLGAFPPRLSPEGTSVVWAASREEEGKRVDLVVDGDVIARADVVMAPPLFRGERKVQWAVRRGKSVHLVTACTRWAPLPLLRPLVCWW